MTWHYDIDKWHYDIISFLHFLHLDLFRFWSSLFGFRFPIFGIRVWFLTFGFTHSLFHWICQVSAFTVNLRSSFDLSRALLFYWEWYIYFSKHTRIRLYIGVNDVCVWGNPPVDLVALLYRRYFQNYKKDFLCEYGDCRE